MRLRLDLARHLFDSIRDCCWAVREESGCWGLEEVESFWRLGGAGFGWKKSVMDLEDAAAIVGVGWSFWEHSEDPKRRSIYFYRL